MKLTDDDRLKIETFAREAARRHYKENNPGATDDQAMHFATRHWRRPDFVQVGTDILAFYFVLDEAEAAPFN